jgi:methionine sulfoxide reductase heme-binding subunit
MKDMSRKFGFRGWSLTGVVGAALLVVVGAACLREPSLTEGSRAVIRLTARTSLALFLLAFSASSLARLFPGAASGWLMANRRSIGLSFALSHSIHLAAILVLARTDYETFQRLTNVVTYISGGLAYILIALMVVTSFDTIAAWLGRRTWRSLHSISMWYLCLSFALNFGKRIPLGVGYALPVALIAAAIVLRLVAMRRGGKPLHAA